MRHFLNINSLSNSDVIRLVEHSIKLKQKNSNEKSDKTVVNLFFENSTRTYSSFQMAENKLGFQQIIIDPQHSSMSKGESLSDTLKTLKAIGIDVAIVRHTTNSWYENIISESDPEKIPQLVNAGDGSGQHPSQSLLDLVTIYEEFSHFDGLKVRIIGDLSHSRVARSNAEILNKLGVEVSFSGPENWQPKDFKQFGQFVDIDYELDKQDVVMFLRVQHERITQTEHQYFSSRQYHGKYGLTLSRYKKLKDNAIVMHPAPVNRDVEIANELVESSKSRIFEQMRNGVFARMAILKFVLEE